MESGAPGAFNVAYGHRINLNHLASILMEITGTECDPIYEAPRPGDIRDSLADITRAREAFGTEIDVTCSENIADITRAREAFGTEIDVTCSENIADITRAREAFEYDPQYLVEEGLRQAVAWFREGA